MSHDLDVTPFAQCSIFAGKRIHLGVTGSIACYKACELLRAFKKLNIDVSATLSEGARHFVGPMLFSGLGAEPVYGEMFDDAADPFSHLEPGKIAKAMLIAPASANALAKLAQGMTCDMLSAQALAFDGPLVLAPAMNPRMWAHAATQASVKILQERGALLVPPGAGLAACGDEGQGRLAELPEIFLAVLKALSPQDMSGLNVMVTLGPTREAWDGVRFWSNPSSGRMGSALAVCAWLRGAEVTAICGPGAAIFLPQGIRRIDVANAVDMFNAANAIWPDMDMGLFCAAVADFAPVRPDMADEVKVKKADMPQKMFVEFQRNPDILQALSQKRKPDCKVLGFAAEIAKDANALLPLARHKLKVKAADMIAANLVNPGKGAFGANASGMAVVDRHGRDEIWQPQAKADIAWELCSWLLKI